MVYLQSNVVPDLGFWSHKLGVTTLNNLGNCIFAILIYTDTPVRKLVDTVRIQITPH